MLLDTEDRTVTSSGHMQVARATIKTSPKIFNFFSDQTYANKPKAICRELAANAVDSQVMAGKGDQPIEIWLPTLLDPTFRVRDHGLGMSKLFLFGDPDNGIPSQFMTYADGSTKDGSNDAIGGFGIGSKSPFAYVDQYTIKSIFDGMEYVGSIFKDADGIPAIGLLGERPTTEPNGVSVEFPVQPNDFVTFETAAFEALRYFEPLPDIKNATVGAFTPPTYVSRGKTWGMRAEAGDLLIIMGGVPYPVSVHNLSYKFPSDSPAHKLLKYGLDLRLPIGTCSVALSREALSYDDKTINAIRVACENVIEEVKASFSTIFDQYDSAWEARNALQRELGDNTVSERSQFLAENALWKGKPITVWLPHPQLSTHVGHNKMVLKTWGYQVCQIEDRSGRAGRGGRVRKVTTSFHAPDNGRMNDYGFLPGKTDILLIDDLEQKPSTKAARKIKEFAEENGQRILVVRPNFGQTISVEEILEGFGNPPADQVVLTSSLPEPEIDRAYVKNKSRPKVRMFTYDGSHIRGSRGGYSNNINPGQYGKDGVYEIPYVDQPTSGILVVMEQFNVPRSDIQQLVNAGLLNWSELHFVNSADAKKLGKQNWVMFNVIAERRKKEKLAAYPELAQRLALLHASELRWLFEFFGYNVQRDFSSRKPLGKIFNLYKKYIEPLDHEQKKLAQFVTAKLPRGVNPAELQQQFKTKQPKANRLVSLLPRHLDDGDFALLQGNL